MRWPRRFGLPYRYAYAMELTGPFLGARLLKHDLEAGTRQVHDFGEGRHPGEFVFVPARTDSKEDEGWLIGLVMDMIAETTDLVVLNARDFEGTPQASIRIPHRVPPGFHGNWVPSKNRGDVMSNEPFTCGLDAALAVIGGKWKPLILYYLAHETRRYGALKRCIRGVSDKMLIQ